MSSNSRKCKQSSHSSATTHGAQADGVRETLEYMDFLHTGSLLLKLTNASLDWDNYFKDHTTRSGLTDNPNNYLYYIIAASWAAAPCLASLSCYQDVIVKTKARSCDYSRNLTVVFLPLTNWVDATCRDNGFLVLWCPSSAFDKNLASA